MTPVRPKRVVAIFGGSQDDQVLIFAKALGRAVADAGHILLTGGTGPAGGKVKNIAIEGASTAPWVGVDRKRSGDPECSRSESGFRIVSGLDHKRNYLEAYMCHAAIALDGAAGTRSEVTCALALQRPVAFVGGNWQREFNLQSDRSGALDRLVDDTLKLFAPMAPLHPLLTEEKLRADLKSLPGHRYFSPGAETAADIVEWTASAVPAGALHSEIPPLHGHSKVAAEYQEWLRAQYD